MADTWWFEETKLLIALRSEEAVQHHEQQETRMGQTKPRNGRWRKLSHPLLLFQTGYFSSSSLRSFLCLSSGLQVKYCGEYHGSCLIGCHFEVTMPSLFEFSQM